MLLIDKYAYTNKLANKSALIKLLVVVIALVITTTSKSNYLNILVLFIMVFMSTFIAGIPMDRYLKIFSIPMGFLFISVITILFSISKENTYLYSIKLFSCYIGLSKNSIDESTILITRVMASMSSTFFLALTTPLNSLLAAFKKLHFSNVLIELIVLIYRSIFIFLEEAHEIYIAQELKLGYTGFKNSLNSTGLLIRSLFLKIILSYKEMVVVLECKLYDGEFKIGD